MSFYFNVLSATSYPDCYWTPEDNTVLNDANRYTAILPKNAPSATMSDNSVGANGRKLRIYMTVLDHTAIVPYYYFFCQTKGSGHWIAQVPGLDTLVTQTSVTNDCWFYMDMPDLYDSDIRAFLSNAWISNKVSSAMGMDVLGQGMSLDNSCTFKLDWQLGHGIVMSGVDYWIQTDSENGYRMKAVPNGSVTTLRQSLNYDSTTYFRFDHCDGMSPELESTTYSIKCYLGTYVRVIANGEYETAPMVYEWEQFTMMPSPSFPSRFIIFSQWPPSYPSGYLDLSFWSFSMTSMYAAAILYTGDVGADAWDYNNCFDIRPVFAG